MPDMGEVATGGGLFAGGGVLAVAAMRLVEAWWSKRRTPEQRLGDAASAASDLIQLAMQASGTSVQQLLSDVADLRRDQAEDRAEIATLRAEVEACHSREAQTAQLNRSLIRLLRAQGIELPAETGVSAFYELNGDDVVALAPVRGMKTGSE